MSTLTVYGEAAGYAQGFSSNFSIARETVSTKTIYSALITGARINPVGSYYLVFQGVINFETGTGDLVGSTINSATLTLVGISQGFSGDTPQTNTIEARKTDPWITDYDTDDWVAGSSMGALPLLASFASTDFVVGDNVFTSDSNFLTGVEKADTTGILVASSAQRTGTPVPTEIPAADSYTLFQIHTSHKLVIDYTEAPPTQNHTQCHF